MRVPFHTLRTGDTIICPTSGLPEKVTYTRHVRKRSGLPGRSFVRTDRHDHNRPRMTTVEKVNDD